MVLYKCGKFGELWPINADERYDWNIGNFGDRRSANNRSRERCRPLANADALKKHEHANAFRLVLYYMFHQVYIKPGGLWHAVTYCDCRKACKLLLLQTSQWHSLIILAVCCSSMADTGLSVSTYLGLSLYTLYICHFCCCTWITLHYWFVITIINHPDCAFCYTTEKLPLTVAKNLVCLTRVIFS